LTQYERLDPDPNDRQPGKSTFPSYRLRAEVSGEFEVAVDGTISIPILGQFKVAGKSVEELRKLIAPAFESALGHAGLITIAIAEQPPIYIDGVVKNAGAFKFTTGLTVFHALSLAGGFQDIRLESHQILFQTMQEADTGEQAKQLLERLLSRAAVLKAELTSTPVVTPQALMDLVGETRAKSLVAGQVEERRVVVETNQNQINQQTQLIEGAKLSLETRAKQVKFFESEIQERETRLKSLEALMSHGDLGKPIYESAQADYLDTQAKKEDAAALMQQSQMQLNDAQLAQSKLKLDTQYALQHELSDLHLQIAQQSVVYRSHLAAVSAITTDPNAVPGAAPLVFDLLRETGGRVATYRVKGTCLLQPGDLVRVFVGSGKASDEIADR
jgi:protein involved in polysaccharide export with SLBB domain